MRGVTRAVRCSVEPSFEIYPKGRPRYTQGSFSSPRVCWQATEYYTARARTYTARAVRRTSIMA